MVGQSSASRGRGRQPRQGRSTREVRRRRPRAEAVTAPEDNVLSFPQTAADTAAVPQRQPHGFEYFLVWLLRLLVLGVGLGAIVGTILALVLPRDYLAIDPSKLEAPALPAFAPPPPPPALRETREIESLHETFVNLAAKKPQLTPGAYFIDLDTGEFLNLKGSEPFSAASTIKVPVLVALFQAIDAGQVSLEDTLTMRPDLIGGGSGVLQYREPNSTYSVLEIAEKNIIISDNTATNMLIDLLGGATVLNTTFQEWGLTHTAIRNPLPDLTGTNTTSPRDLVKLMALLEQGRLVSPESRDRILEIMHRTKTRTLLPRGLGEGATIANKTGDIGSMVGDIGSIRMPSGKRYLASVLVTRPHNDRNAQALIRAYSKAAYQYFDSLPPHSGDILMPAE